MADLVARGLAVPGKDLVVDQGARRLGQAEGCGQQVGGPFGPVRQAQQPVGRHPQRGRGLGRQLGAGHPGRPLGQHLAEGGAVHPGGAGQRALRQAAVGHGLTQALAEQVGAVAAVGHRQHLLISVTTGSDMLIPILILQQPRGC